MTEHAAIVALDMNPDSVRVNVQTTVLVFSLKANNLEMKQTAVAMCSPDGTNSAQGGQG